MKFTELLGQLKDGVVPAEVKVEESLTVLRDRAFEITSQSYFDESAWKYIEEWSKINNKDSKRRKFDE